MLGVHRKLQTYVRAALFLSAAVGMAGAVAIAAGWPAIRGSVGPPQWPFLIFGVVAFLSSFLVTVIVPRWYRHASRIVSSAAPKAGRIVVEIESDSDSTSLFMEGSSARRVGSRIGLLMPTWSVQPLLGKPVDVGIYMDHVSERPVAFATSRGLLWCMPWWQRAA